MTMDQVLHPAEERLLDAALAQVLRPVRTTTTPRSTRRMLAAALVLLGLTIVGATAWLVREPQRDDAQEPEAAPMPAEVPGEGRAGLEALPVTTENVLAKFTDPRELPVVARFERLRALRLWPEKTTILGISTGTYHGAWSKPPADLLAPLAKLTRLEVLGLPHELAVSPELLAPLAGHPSLREIQFVRDGFAIDERLVAALAKVPRLRSLHLSFVPLGDRALLHLAALPLTSLELEWCGGLDAAGWQAIASMRTLQRLAFRDWAWNVKQGEPAWRPSTEDLRRLAGLPRLRRLELLDCAVDDEQLAALPDTLTTLSLFGTKLTPEGIGGLRRLAALRELDFVQRGAAIADLFKPDSDEAANAFGEALSSLRLRRLHYRGALTPTVADAIGEQSGIDELSITCKKCSDTTFLAALPLHRVVWRGPVTADLLEALASRPDLRELELPTSIPDATPLAAAPRLERLTLVGDGIAPSVLAPLAHSPALREIVLHTTVPRGEPRPSEADLQKAVGDRIRLVLLETEVTVKK